MPMRRTKNPFVGKELEAGPNIGNNLPLAVVEHVSHPSFVPTKRV